MMYSALNTAAVVLSGGAGTRLNGVDKGLQLYQGKALIEHVIETIVPQIDTAFLCVNRNFELYQAFGIPIITDNEKDYQGPMSGISSALTSELMKSIADQVLVSSCDAPNLPSNIRARLEARLISSSSIDVAIAHDGNRRQNLHCLIKRQAWQSLIDFFEHGGRAMHRWFDQVNAIDVDFSSEAECFLNINTLEQLNHTNR